MKEKILDAVGAILIYVSIIVSFTVAVILFIPTFVYAILCGLTIQESFKCFWIEGWYNTIRSGIDEY